MPVEATTTAERFDQYVGWNLYSSTCLEAQINQQIVERYTEVDAKGKFLHPPSNNEELDEFTWLAYGIWFPKKVITPGHKAPFEFFTDLFFERVKNALAFGNRASGKTFLISILNHLDMVFKSNCEISSAGSTKDQAGYGYNYFQDYNRLPWFKKFCERFVLKTGRNFFEDMWSIQSKTEFGNGSILRIITGSEKGLRGPHPHKSRIDEIDELEWGVLQTGLSMSRSADGIRGQDVFTSTRQHEHGTMQRLLDEADEKGIAIYEWNIWEALETCTRRCIDDPVHGTCPILSFCNGKAHDCEGHYRIDDFINRARMLDKDRFAIEWLNEKPAKDKMVYGMFTKERHVLTPQLLHRMCGVSEPSLQWHRVNAIDFGSSPGNPFVFLNLCRLPNGAWLISSEYVAEQKLLRDHARAIQATVGYNRGSTIYADHDAQDRLELEQYGIRTKPAVKGPKSISVGIDRICELLHGYPPKNDPMLYVWHTCQKTIEEFVRYQWPIREDGRPDRTGIPMPGHDHCMDAMRYAIFSDYRFGLPKYRTRSMSGI